MLPKELLRLRVRGGLARPTYIVWDRDRQVLDDVLDAFSRSAAQSWKYSELEDQLSGLAEVYDYRLVKGLARLLRRRISLGQTPKFEPQEARRLLFSMGPVLADDERSDLLRSVADKFSVSVEELEDGMFSDAEWGKRVTGFSEISRDDLASWYNAELAETMVARSTRLIVRATKQWSSILRRVKGLGLMYEVLEGYERGIEVTGPASALRSYDRYGRAAAGLIPLLSEVGGWTLEGELGMASGKRLPFIVDSAEADMRYPSDVIRQDVRVFDSGIEEKFYRALRQAAPDLKITREPAPLRAGGGVMVPDFSVEVEGHSVYVEIVGFWTPEYIRRKLEKLSSVEQDVIVIADSSLGISRFEGSLEGVIFYDGGLPIKRILEAIGARIGARRRPAAMPQGSNVRPEPSPELEEMIDGLVGMSLDEVEPRLAAALGASWPSILEEMGYGFEWRTLDAKGARLVKIGVRSRDH